MTPDLYTRIKSTIRANTTIKDVMLYRLPDSDTIARSPLVMVEFPDITYENMTGKKQEVNATFTLHLLCDSIQIEDDITTLQFTQDIYKALTGAGFIRRRESSKVFDEATFDWQLTYEAPRFEDKAAVPVMQTIDKPDPAIIVG